MERWNESVSGRAGLKASGLGDVDGSYHELDAEEGAMREPFRFVRASVIREWRRRNCDDMKVAEERSPVHLVMSTQSRDWLSKLRRLTRGVRMRVWSGARAKRVGFCVLRRRWRD